MNSHRNHIAVSGLALFTIAAHPFSARGQCAPQWLLGDGIPGMDSPVSAATTWDPDGLGPLPEVLAVGGSFEITANFYSNRVAIWDGTAWSTLGSGTNGPVCALQSFDDGAGPALYAGGDFTAAGGVAANHIAKWDGSEWSPVGGGTNDDVLALVVFDDGTGDALYAAGAFTTAGGVVASRIAKWDGTSWSAVGSGMNGPVSDLAVFADGRPGVAAALFAGGDFTTADVVAANHIARWDGDNWTPLSSGLNNDVRALAVFEHEDELALYVGGSFTMAGGSPASRIAKWNGSSWSTVGAGVGNSVHALATFDGGDGLELYATGNFVTAGGAEADHFARWNGSSWSPVGQGLSSSAGMLAVFNGGTGEKLYVGGIFAHAGETPASCIAAWDGASWSPMAPGLNGQVKAMTVFDDGAGPVFYAGGVFTNAGAVPASGIAKWDGRQWSALGAGIGVAASSSGVIALTAFDDGSGPALYAGGDFVIAGGAPASRVARWDGSGWSPLGTGINGGPIPVVFALCAYDDGVVPALYAGGQFELAGGQSAKRIAKWDGQSWSSLGTGMSGTVSPYVDCLAVFNDGTGAALFAGGGFTMAGGVPANNIAKWNGTGFSPLGAGVNGGVWALAVFDDGNGEKLYAGGIFTMAAGGIVNRIAKWNGTAWSPVGVGVWGTALETSISHLAVFNDDGGPLLVAGGQFTSAGGVSTNGIAKWNGTSWSSLGLGVGGLYPKVRVLSVFDDGDGPALYAGGPFTTAGTQLSPYLARWRRPWGDLSGDASVELADWSPFVACWTGPESVAPSGCDCADTDVDADVDLADFAVFQRRFLPQ